MSTTRRRILRTGSLAFAGAALTPLGRCIAETIRNGESGKTPLRFLFFLQGNGFYPDQIQPRGIALPPEPGRLEDRPLSGHDFPKALEPLQPFRDRLAIVQGLSGRVTGPPGHSAGFGALGCYPERKQAFGETIDAALAKHHPGIFPHVGLGVSEKQEDAVIYNVSAWSRGKALPTQCQPGLAYRRLFANATGGDSKKAFNTETNILEFLADDVRRLKSQLGAREREKLDIYLDSLSSMSERQATLARTSSRIPGEYRNLAPKSFPIGAGGFEHLDAHFEIAANAFITGLTNVVTISSGSGLEFLGIRVDGAELGFAPGQINMHGLGHHAGFCGQDWRDLQIAIHRRHAQALAEFLQQLDTIPEGEGTMLDNTLIVYTSDQAEGHHPRCYEWPFVIIGDLQARIKTRGRYLRYPWYGNPGHRTTSNLFTTLLHAAGARRDRFGMVDPSLADLDQDGPLAELLT